MQCIQPKHPIHVLTIDIAFRVLSRFFYRIALSCKNLRQSLDVAANKFNALPLSAFTKGHIRRSLVGFT
jgi:hypothetical protein